MTNDIILVAGNPDAYPIEYYNADTGSYEGLIPELFQRFSAEYGYKVEYYDSGLTDMRAELAADGQVDVVSACTGSESFAGTADEVELLNFTYDGQLQAYKLFCTDVAGEEFAADMRSFFSGVSQETMTGIIIDQTEHVTPLDQSGVRLTLIGAAVILILFVLAAAAFIRHYRRRLKALEKDRETDEATGIGNQEYLIRYYKQFVNDRNRTLYNLLYVYVDSNRLDRINGRGRADELLRHAAMVIQDHTADSDILARVAEDGFVLLRTSLDEEEELRWLEPVAERLDSKLTDKEFSAGTRYWAVGCYRLQRTDRDINEMIFDAAQCARAAYRDGDKYRLCTDEVLRVLAGERQLKADMKHGLDNGEFLLYLQPYVRADNGQPIGAEALTRWNHPARGLLLPGEFLPFMEQENLVAELDYCAMRNACEFLQDMWERGDTDFFISCNFSRETAAAQDFIDKCKEILEQYDFPLTKMIFEFDCGASLNAESQLAENVRTARRLGVFVALDDFGEGFSALAGAGDFAPDIVKINRRLVSGIGTDSGESVIRGMINVCCEMGVSPVAVGVEEESQADFLYESGCDILQGYCFYRPMPEWQVKKMLTAELT